VTAAVTVARVVKAAIVIVDRAVKAATAARAAKAVATVARVAKAARARDPRLSLRRRS
jgi:hypothetical protein